MRGHRPAAIAHAALASPSLLDPESDLEGVGYSMYGVAYQRAGFYSCVWHQPDDMELTQVRQFSVLLLPGGGWAWNELKASTLDRDGETISVEGADDAVIACWDPTECGIEALVDGSYLNINMSYVSDSGVDARPSAITALEFVIAHH